MSGIRVVTDSACDLPPELAAAEGVTIVPLTIRFGGEELVDGRDLTTAGFWERCGASPVLPETAAPSPGAFEAAFRDLAEQGAEGIVCVNISSHLSATMQSAQVAAGAVASQIPVRVVDSRFASMGQGLMVLAAARMAGQGKGLDDVAGTVEDLIPRTKLLATLDTLENLKKGGRIGGAQALIGTVLSIKPVIQVLDGAVEQESKQRTRARSLRYLVDKVKESAPVESVTVMHGQAPDLEEMLEMLDEVVPRSEVLVGLIGPVIGTHAGPRAIGVTFHTATSSR
jgi:DegV family protein with EDD domain